MHVERRIAAGNKVNRALAALMRWPYTMQCWYRRCYTAAKRGYYRRRMKERWMPWRCDLFVGYAESAYLIESAMKRYTEWQVLATLSRWGMKKNVLSWVWARRTMTCERMAKKNSDWKVTGKRGMGRPRLTFKNTVSNILEEGHVKSMRILRKASMKRLTTVDETKEIWRDRSVWRFVLSDYPVIYKAWS